MGLSYKRIMFSLSVFVIIISLVSCTSNFESSIIGKWKETNGKTTIEFFKDGTVNEVEYGRVKGGKYEFVDKDIMKIEGALTGPIMLKVSIKDDELTLTISNGDILKYKREN